MHLRREVHGTHFEVDRVPSGSLKVEQWVQELGIGDFATDTKLESLARRVEDLLCAEVSSILCRLRKGLEDSSSPNTPH